MLDEPWTKFDENYPNLAFYMGADERYSLSVVNDACDAYDVQHGCNSLSHYLSYFVHKMTAYNVTKPYHALPYHTFTGLDMTCIYLLLVS